MTTEAIQGELITSPRHGGINENRNDTLDGLYARVMGLQRTDYAVPANSLRVDLSGTGASLDAVNHASGESMSFGSTPYALDQLSDRLSKGVRSFGHEMIGRGHRDLYQTVLNELLERAPSDQKFQLRTIQPNGHRIARAVVSDKFKPIDDDLCLPSVVQLVGDQSKRWKSLGGQITDTRTFCRFISREPTVRGLGPNNRDWFVGFQYSNSEVGQGLCSFHLFFYDSYCENGCVFGQKSILDVNFRHIGSRITTGFGVVSDERLQQAELLNIQAMIQEATTKVLSQDFESQVRQYFENATARTLDGVDQLEAIRQIGKSVGLTKTEVENVGLHWDSSERNAGGVSSAITRLAQDADDYTARVRLEKAGGDVLSMSDRQWKSVLALAS